MSYKPKLKKKRWQPSREREVIKYWEEKSTFKFERDNRPVFIIDTPPPYISGRAHLGFAIHYAQIDMIARYYRMKGHNVIFPACTDRNGLPVEVKVEQKLNKSMHDIPRDTFLKICKEELDKAEKNTIMVMKWMGLSCNAFYGSPEIYYQTDSPKYRYNTQKTFCKAWHAGEIYFDKRPNNWCVECGTTIADAEIEYKDDTAELYQIKFPLKGTDDYLTIATTRPELIPTCEMIIYHPTDKRYTHLENKHAITPLFGKEVPIYSHHDANPDFGTGILMICAYGDKSDVKIIREKGITDAKTVIEPDGKLNSLAGKYQGLTVKEARKAILEDLEAEGFLVDKITTQRRVPICWRSKTPIEIIAMDEFYLKQVDYLPKLRELANQMEFYPSYHKIILDNWIDSINIDWSISRRRFYGTSIPIWYCPKCNSPNVPTEDELDRYYEAWKEKSPIKECKHCGASMENSVGEQRTFDTWFDSSISELAACNYGGILFEDKNGEFFNANFPCSIRPQGKEIVRTWLYYTLLRSFHLFRKPAFKKVWISGLVLDPFGGKMSKSLGNSVDPLVFLQPPILPKNTPKELIPERDGLKNIIEGEDKNKKIPNLYLGADSIRLTSCLQGSHGSNIRFSLKKLEGNSKFITKLWNVSRFISSFPYPNKPITISQSDEWILKSLDVLINRCKEGYEKLDFSVPAESIYNWVWNLFAPHYVELVKTRAYKEPNGEDAERDSAQYTLHYCLQSILKLLAPICPFITEAIYQEIYEPNSSIHLELFPTSTSDNITEPAETAEIINLDSLIWKTKRENGLSLKDKITEIFIPKILEPFIVDIKQMHNVYKITIITKDSDIPDNAISDKSIGILL